VVRSLQNDRAHSDELAGEYGDKLKIGKVDVDTQQSLAAQYRVQSIPTLLLFKQGQILEQIVGLKSKRDLKASLDRALA
jgi:thioredoxin 1